MCNGHTPSSLLLMGLGQCYLCCYISDKLRLVHQSKERTGHALLPDIFKCTLKTWRKTSISFWGKSCFLCIIAHFTLGTWENIAGVFPDAGKEKNLRNPFFFFLCFFGLPRCQICQLFRPSSDFLKSHYWLLIQR